MPQSSFIVGDRLDEREAFHNLVEALKIAETCARQIGFMRQQPTWFKVSGHIGGLRDRTVALANGATR